MRQKKVQNILTIEASILADLQRRWCTEAAILINKLQSTLLPANKPSPPLPVEEARNEGIVISIQKESAMPSIIPATTSEQRMPAMTPVVPVPLHAAPTLRRRTRSWQSSEDCLLGKWSQTAGNRAESSASSPSIVSSMNHPSAKGLTSIPTNRDSLVPAMDGGLPWFCPSRVWEGVVNFVTEVSLTTSEAVDELIV